MIWTENNNYCLTEINESVKGIEVNKKLADNARDVKITKGCKSMVDYHKETLFENLLYLLDNLGYTLKDIQNYNKEEKIL